MTTRTNLGVAPLSSLPQRTGDTMSDAIALSSPNGRMSKRARKAATERLRVALFGEAGLPGPRLPPQPTKKERLLRDAAMHEDLARRGMRPRAGLRLAAALRAEAAKISD